MSQTTINSLQNITLTKEDLLYQLQLSCRVPDLVEQILTRQIVTTTAAASKIEVTTQELQQAADHMRVVSKLTDAKSTWAWLEKHNLSLDDFEAIVRDTVISAKLAAHLFRDRVEPHFYEHQLNYAGAAIYEIILEDKDEAIELFYEIKEDEISFHDAARQYIQDTELRRKGGYLGKVARTQMLPEVSMAVFASDTPRLLQPIVTSQGAHLILVEEIINPELNDKLRQKIMLDLFSQWLKQQIKQIKYTFVDK